MDPSFAAEATGLPVPAAVAAEEGQHGLIPHQLKLPSKLIILLMLPLLLLLLAAAMACRAPAAAAAAAGQA